VFKIKVPGSNFKIRSSPAPTVPQFTHFSMFDIGLPASTVVLRAPAPYRVIPFSIFGSDHDGGLLVAPAFRNELSLV
jgi:hypothetical protein